MKWIDVTQGTGLGLLWADKRVFVFRKMIWNYWSVQYHSSNVTEYKCSTTSPMSRNISSVRRLQNRRIWVQYHFSKVTEFQFSTTPSKSRNISSVPLHQNRGISVHCHSAKVTEYQFTSSIRLIPFYSNYWKLYSTSFMSRICSLPLIYFCARFSGFGKVFDISHVHLLGKPMLNSTASNFVHVYASLKRTFHVTAGLLVSPVRYEA
jgi:hypothetical protein